MRTIHAEMNAVLQCAKFGVATENAEVYVTDFPCLQCTKMLLQAGIKKLFYLRNYHNDEYALKLMKLKNVDVQQVKLDAAYLQKVANDSLFENIRELNS